MTTPTQNTISADAAKVLQFATKEQIARSIIRDETPRDDGYTYKGRVAFVLATFGAETLDLETVFDWNIAFNSSDPSIVEAYQHLAMLQAGYFESLYYYQYINDEQWDAYAAGFMTIVSLLGTHLAYIYAGREDENYCVIV